MDSRVLDAAFSEKAKCVSIDLYILLAGCLEVRDQLSLLIRFRVSLQNREFRVKGTGDFLERSRLVIRRSRTIASRIKSIHASSGCPHVMTNSDTVVVVLQDMIDRLPKRL